MNTIQNKGSWKFLSERINQNFAEIASDLLYLKKLGLARYFNSEKDLNIALPPAERKDGEQAYVGVSAPYSIYRVVKGKWTATGEYGGNESGSYDAAIERIDNILKALDVPASNTANGFMTSEMVKRVESMDADVASLKSERLSGKGNSTDFSVALERGNLPATEMSMPIHGSNPGTPALITPADYSKFLTAINSINLHGQLLTNYSKKIKPATENNEGLMSVEQVKKLESLMNMKIIISAEGPAALHLSLLNEYGYTMSLPLEIPVHGGSDGSTAAPSAALISKPIFEKLSTYLKNVDQFDKMLTNIPVSFDAVVSVVSYKNEPSSSAGKKVYDTNSGLMLWEVTTQQGSAVTHEYYQKKADDASIGKYPQQGRVYLCGNRTFIGVSNGLSELFKV